MVAQEFLLGSSSSTCSYDAAQHCSLKLVEMHVKLNDI